MTTTRLQRSFSTGNLPTFSVKTDLSRSPFIGNFKERALTDFMTPHHQETGFSCGAAVVIMIIKRFNLTSVIDETMIRDSLNTNDKVGTELEKIKKFFENQKNYVLGGFSDHLDGRSHENIKNAMCELLEIASGYGIPMIVGVKEYAGHYLIFKRVKDDKVYCIDPMAEPIFGKKHEVEYKLDDFCEKWFFDFCVYGKNVIGRQGAFVATIPDTEVYANAKKAFENWKDKYKFTYQEKTSLYIADNTVTPPCVSWGEDFAISKKENSQWLSFWGTAKKICVTASQSITDKIYTICSLS